MMNQKAFAEVVAGETTPLIKDGFTVGSIVSVHRRHELLLRNASTGIGFVWEVPDEQILVRLYRLVNGVAQASTADPTDGFYFGSLLELRAPHESLPTIEREPFSPLEMKRVVREYVRLLMVYASDVLKGDFTVFDQLRKAAELRAREFGVTDAANPYIIRDN
jgi:hypothetical protein